MAEHFKMLLSPPIERPRVADELAGCFAVADGVPALVALVVSPFGSKVWRVEVGRDGEGAFLGRGWPEFLAAHGIGVDWFVVLRHEGGATLTVKAFDASFCIKEFRAPAEASSTMANKNIKGLYCKPQFIRVMQLDFMEKMMIPAKFVKHYVTDEYMNCQMAAVILDPLGKFWQFKVEKDRSGMFFSGDWSHFVAFHGISEGDIVLVRYEGNLVFKFKAFDLNGSMKDFEDHNTRIQQDTGKQQEGNSGSFSRKRKTNDAENPCHAENKKRSSGFMTLLNKASLRKEADYQTRPPFWIRKAITTCTLEKHTLPLSPKFCRCIGFEKSCTITLKTEMESIRSWKVHGLAYEHVNYLGHGWKIFCQDNRLKEGDVCTFNIVKTFLWHVTIMRESTVTYNDEQQKAPPHSVMKCMSKNDSSSTEGQKGPDGFRTSFKNVLHTRSVYEVGPPSWIQKEMTTRSLKNLYLAQGFFIAIRLQGPCTITLKTSIDSAKSWQVDVSKEKKGSYQLGQDWCKFCQDNRLKEGDICTFKVVKIKLWHVVIARG